VDPDTFTERPEPDYGAEIIVQAVGGGEEKEDGGGVGEAEQVGGAVGEAEEEGEGGGRVQ